MTKRLLVLFVVLTALAVPALSLADDGGSSNAPAPTAAGALAGRHGAVLDRVSKRLDRRFQVFSGHCLVQNAPDRCSKAANRYVRGLQKLSTLLGKVEAKIKEKCAAANAPARCSSATDAIARIDALLAKLASESATIKAAFPNAGGSS